MFNHTAKGPSGSGGVKAANQSPLGQGGGPGRPGGPGQAEGAKKWKREAGRRLTTEGRQRRRKRQGSRASPQPQKHSPAGSRVSAPGTGTGTQYTSVIFSFYVCGASLWQQMGHKHK